MAAGMGGLNVTDHIIIEIAEFTAVESLARSTEKTDNAGGRGPTSAAAPRLLRTTRTEANVDGNPVINVDSGFDGGFQF